MGRRGPEAASTVDPADIRRLPIRIGSAGQDADSSGAGSFQTRGSRCCVQPGPHNVVGSARTSSLGATRRPMTICLGRVCWCELAHHRPQKADEFARHGDDRDLRPPRRSSTPFTPTRRAQHGTKERTSTCRVRSLRCGLQGWHGKSRRNFHVRHSSSGHR